MLSEFDARTVGIGVVIVAASENRKTIGDYFPLLLLTMDKKNEGIAAIRLNPEIEEAWQANERQELK